MDMILNNRFEEPYSKFAPEGSIPILSKTLVKSRLSPKFWKCTEKIYEEVSKKKNNSNVEEDYKNYKGRPEDQEVDINNNYNIPNNENNINVNNQRLRAKAPLKGSNNYSMSQGENDIDKLKNLITKLQNEIAQKDTIIQNQKEEKIRLNKRVDELEKMLSSFLVSLLIFLYNLL